jgi:hypothetical protein
VKGCLRETHTYTFSLTPKPKRRNVWEHAGWKIRQLVVVKIKVAERRSERELGLTLVASQLKGMCGCVSACVCVLVVFRQFICVSVCVHAWFLVLVYVFKSCYACAIDIWRAQTLAQSCSHSLSKCNTVSYKHYYTQAKCNTQYHTFIGGNWKYIWNNTSHINFWWAWSTQGIPRINHTIWLWKLKFIYTHTDTDRQASSHGVDRLRIKERELG